LREIVLGCKLVCEPSGAVGVAGFLEHHAVAGHGPAVAVVSGGNIEPKALAELLGAGPTAEDATP
ncbi:MAG: hypothetical protein QOD45_1841, partial [Pseudonocardiales bacterium]|nr:hypothetical protein [Pseudonocardiales bacterium]